MRKSLIAEDSNRIEVSEFSPSSTSAHSALTCLEKLLEQVPNAAGEIRMRGSEQNRSEAAEAKTYGHEHKATRKYPRYKRSRLNFCKNG